VRNAAGRHFRTAFSFLILILSHPMSSTVFGALQQGQLSCASANQAAVAAGEHRGDCAGGPQERRGRGVLDGPTIGRLGLGP